MFQIHFHQLSMPKYIIKYYNSNNREAWEYSIAQTYNYEKENWRLILADGRKYSNT